MPRQVLIAGNWKLNLSVAEGVALVGELREPAGKSQAEVLVCPTFLGVAPAIDAAAGSRIQVGAQNCYWEDSGAFTGEVSAALVAACGASHVLIGHSERRQLFGESDETVNRRLRAALTHSLVPVVCIGETLEEREAGRLEEVLRRQVDGALEGFEAEVLRPLVIAYEPVWAIGTGVVATTEQAQEAHAFVRSLLAERLGDLADETRILYGGSAKPDNAGDLLGCADIDGALVGGASLKADSFAAIIAAAAS